MDWITLDALKTFAGASAAVTLFVGMVKRFSPGLSGRGTQLCAAFVSLVLAAVIFKPLNIDAVVVTVCNALVILAASMGWDQLAHYER